MGSAETQEIKGLPPGATVEPIVASNGTIRGLPAGAVVEPIAKSAAQPASQKAAQQLNAGGGNQVPTQVAGLPQGATLHPVEPTPQEKIFQSTVGEGQSTERAQQRVNEYNYAIKQGLNPDRAQQFAQSLQWPDAPKQTLTDEQQKNIYQNALQQAQDFKSGKQPSLETHWFGESLLSAPNQNDYRQHLDPEEYARNYVKGYTYAKAQGWDEGRSQQYAASDASARLESRIGAAVEPVWQSSAGWVAKKLGIHHPYERVVNPWLESDEQVRNDEFVKYKDLSWADKVAEQSKWKGWLAKGTVGIDNGAADLVGGLTSAQNLALMATGEAGGLVGATGLETPVAAQKAVRTVSKLANAGFMYQMAHGTVDDAEQVVSAAQRGDVAETIEFAISGVGNAWMVKHGVDHAKAERAVREVLDRHAEDIFNGKKFGDLKTEQQAAVLYHAINQDPMFQEIEGVSEKQAKKNLDLIKYRQSVALQQAWNPNAAQRAIRKIHADRIELRAKQQENAVQESIRKAAEENKKAEAVKREKIISDNDAAKAKNEKVRTERETETPRPQVTETVPKAVVDGEEMYGPVTHLEQEAHIGTEPVGNGVGVFIRDKDGTKQYLNSSGYFGSEEAAASVPDSETADTLARIQALKTTVGDDTEKDTHLDNVTQQLLAEEISARHAQDVTGIGGGGEIVYRMNMTLHVGKVSRVHLLREENNLIGTLMKAMKRPDCLMRRRTHLLLRPKRPHGS